MDSDHSLHQYVNLDGRDIDTEVNAQAQLSSPEFGPIHHSGPEALQEHFQSHHPVHDHYEDEATHQPEQQMHEEQPVQVQDHHSQNQQPSGDQVDAQHHDSTTSGEPLNILLDAIASHPSAHQHHHNERIDQDPSSPFDGPVVADRGSHHSANVGSFTYHHTSQPNPSSASHVPDPHTNQSIQGLLEASVILGTDSNSSSVTHEHPHHADANDAEEYFRAQDEHHGQVNMEEDYTQFVHGEYHHPMPLPGGTSTGDDVNEEIRGLDHGARSFEQPDILRNGHPRQQEGFENNMDLIPAQNLVEQLERQADENAQAAPSTAELTLPDSPNKKASGASNRKKKATASSAPRPRKRKTRPSEEGNAEGHVEAGNAEVGQTNGESSKVHKQRLSSREIDDEEDDKVPKISRMFAATMGPNGSRIPEQQMSFSTISVLCGWVAQKSYGKEKRFLCPPPVVRMNGGVSETIETIALQIVNHDIGPEIPLISNSQGVKFNVEGKEAEARDYLRDGLYFPGLYASRTGKARTLKLKLNVIQPGGTNPRPESLRREDRITDSSERKDRDDDVDMSMLNGQADGQGSMFDDFSRSDLEVNGMNILDPTPLGEDLHHQEGHRPVPPEIEGMIDHHQQREESGEEAPAPSNDMVQDISTTDARPWAVFEGTPMTILSKPSKKTSKTRGTPSSALQIGDPIALWSRINSQSIRTKYMFVQHGSLLGKPSDWSAFVMDVVKKGQPPENWEGPVDLSDDPNEVTYGSIVILRDIHTNFRTEPLLLCKVENGKCKLADWGPVSQLQKVAFARTVTGQGRWYLRAPGQDRDKIDEATGQPTKRIRKRIRGKKDTVNTVIKKRLAPALDQEENLEDGPILKFVKPKIQIEVIDGQEKQTEFMDDFISWSLSGITEHNYTFFEGRHEVGDFSTVFKSPLTPVPTLLDIPLYNPQDNSVTMTVTEYLYDDDNVHFRGKPLLLYLGAIGPLRLRTYKSTAPLIQAPPEGESAAGIALNSYPAVSTDGSDDLPPEARPYSSIPSSQPHTILVIQLPAPHDMWEATRIERERYQHNEHLKMIHEESLGAELRDVMDDTYMEPNFEELQVELQTSLAKVSKPRLKPKQEESDSVVPEDEQPPSIVEESQPEPPIPEQLSHPVDEQLEDIYVNHDMDHQDQHDPRHPEDPQRFLEEAYANMEAFGNDPGHGSILDPVLQDFQPDVSEDVHELFTQAALQAAAAAASGEDHLIDPDSILSAAEATSDPTEHEIASMVREHQDDSHLDQHLGQVPLPDMALDTIEEPSVSNVKQKGKRGRRPKPVSNVTPRIPKPPKPKSERKPRAAIIRPQLAPNPMVDVEPPQVRISKKPFAGQLYAQGHAPRDTALGHSSLPLLFLRQSDGTGYHTGKNVVIERLYPDTENETWGESKCVGRN